MKISIQIKPNAKAQKVEKKGDHEYIVWVKEPTKEGRANQALIKGLAEYFKIPKSSVAIISGRTSRKKVITLG